ncbi:unnamed protein product [Trichobilharzia regenti]|nr:unnamed protein product [Trichobilharzia regenti]
MYFIMRMKKKTGKTKQQSTKNMIQLKFIMVLF